MHYSTHGRRATEFCVLGLLMMRDMTIYELGRAFRQNLSLFYSASLGSLQVAVKKLLARRLVSYRQVSDGGRHKKVYRVLPAGRVAFRAGMKAAIPTTKLEVTALSRLSFLGLLNGTERREVLSIIVEAIGKALGELVRLKRELDVQKTGIPQPLQDIFRYQVLPLDYGIMAHRAGLRWFVSVLEQLKRAEARATSSCPAPRGRAAGTGGRPGTSRSARTRPR